MKKFILVLMLLIVPSIVHAKLVTEEINYKSDQGDTLKGYIAYDDSFAEKRPGILVVHEWWGHNAYSRKRAEMLAQLGYTALAIDMYGDGKQADHPDKAGEYATVVSQKFDTVGKSRFLAALDIIKNHPTVNSDKIAAIGYCFGGGTVLNMARLGVDLKGVVSFHGSLNTAYPAQKGNVKAKVLVCHGADDSFITTEQISAFKNEMKVANVDYKFISYKDAKHGFTSKEADENAKKFNLPIGYNKRADEKSWNDMQKFLKQIF